MVRTVKKQGGFSFVEILVSMVLLSIVVLLMGNMLVGTTRSQGAAKSGNDAEMIALQKLAELQHQNAEPTTGVVTAPAPVVKNNVSYTVKWSISDEEPRLAKVRVEWTGENGSTKSVQEIGFIAIDNSCLVSGNSPPTGITFTQQSIVTKVSATEFTVYTRPSTAFAQDEIVEMATNDLDLGDNHTYTIISQDQDGPFAVKENMLITTKELDSPDWYTVKILTTDCNKNSITDPVELTINVEVLPSGPTYINLTSPNNNSSFTAGDNVTIRWNDDGVGNVTVRYYKDGSWNHPIATNISNTGSYSWTAVEGADTLQVYAISNPSGLNDKHNITVNSADPTYINLTSPNNNSSFTAGDNVTIRWNDDGVSKVWIRYYKNGSWNHNIGDNIPNTGSYSWTAVAGATKLAVNARPNTAIVDWHYITVKSADKCAGLPAWSSTLYQRMGIVKNSTYVKHNNGKYLATGQYFNWEPGTTNGNSHWTYKTSCQ